MDGQRGLLRIALHVFCLLCVPALIAWITHLPFIFPSLGPSAFALATDDKENSGCRVIGGHLIGVLAGLAAYYSLAQGLSLTQFSQETPVDVLRLGMSGTLSVVATAIGMLIAKTEHSPACASTLIVSLGLLPKIQDGAIMMLAVILMVGLHKGIRA